MDIERIVREVDSLRSWGVEVLKKMVSIPTINPPGENYGEFVQYAKEVLASIGMEVKVYEVPRRVVERKNPELAPYPRYILVARAGKGSRVLEINGHYDVVPPGSGWSRDPFKPVIENNKLYGRGAVDMKGGIASAIIAARALIDSGAIDELDGSVELLLVPDEEIGGETGTGYALESGIVKPSYVVIAEPSGVDRVWIGHRGAVWGFVEVFGRQCHASTPWQGINAFTYLARIAIALEERYGKEISERVSRYEYDDERSARPTIAVGGEVRGGAKINIVPGYFAASIDRRLIVEERPEDVEREISEFIERVVKELGVEGLRAAFRPVHHMPPSITDPDTPLVRGILEACARVVGSRPRTVVCSGGLDAWYYTTRGIPAVTFGPGPTDTAHVADEYVDLDQVTAVAKVFAILALEILGRR